MFITPAEIGLSFDDFQFEIIKCTEDPTYYMSFTPRENVECKVNGVFMILNCNVNRGLAKDFGIDIEDVIRDAVKTEAVLKLINSTRYLRKMKLNKIFE